MGFGRPSAFTTPERGGAAQATTRVVADEDQRPAAIPQAALDERGA
jgi:hypothetical protein